MTDINKNLELLCCENFANTIETYGDGLDRGSVKGLSVQFFEAGGHLCFHDLIIDGISNPFGVTINIDGTEVFGKIKATGKFTNNEVVYVSPNGNFYKGKLESSKGFENFLIDQGKCETPPQDDLFSGIYPIASFENAFSIIYDSNTNEISFIEAFSLDTIYKAEAIIPQDVWTHLAIVRKNKKLFFYLNGRKTGEALDNDIRYGEPTKITIGRGKGTDTEHSFFLGEIDSLKVINNFVKYHCNFEPKTINESILPETPTPTQTPTKTPTPTKTATPSHTPIPEKSLRVYINVGNLSSSVKVGDKEHFVDEFTEFKVLPNTQIEFTAAPNAEYKFLRIHGQIDWLKENHTGSMPNRDVDVYFEYRAYSEKDYLKDCEEHCPCDDSEPILVLPNNDPRIDLTFVEHTEDKKEFIRVIEFEDNLPSTQGIDCEYNVTLIDDGLYIKNIETNSEYAWRDLILIRNNKYKFNFDENDCIFKIYDLDGNVLETNDGFYNTEEWIYPLIVLPTDKTPDFLYYELINKNISHRGKIQVKNINHLSGVVTGYNYVFGSKTDIVSNEETLKKVATYKNGVFHIGLDNYVDANELIIESTSGFESVLESNVNLMYRNVPGHLHTNAITTLFYFVLEESRDYKKTEKEIKKYFKLDSNIDLLSHDFMTTFMWTTNLSFEDLTKILFINLLMDFANKHDKLNNLLTVVKNQILDSNQIFKFTNDYFVKTLMHESELNEDFADLFSLVFVKILMPKHRNLHQQINDLYVNLKLLKESAVKSSKISVYLFQSTYEKELKSVTADMINPILLPDQILLKSEDCTNPQLGKYVIRKFDDLLTKSVFDDTKLDFTMLRKLNNRTLRIYALQRSFCYTCLPYAYNTLGIYDEVDSYRIYGDYENADDCCDIVKRNEGYTTEGGEVTQTENEILPVKLVEAGSSRTMLSTSVTNFSHPIEEIGNNQYRIYVNEKISAGNVLYSSPGYFTTTRESANDLMYRGVDVGYNSGEFVREVISATPDYTLVNILTTWMVVDGTLNIVTDINPNLNVGDYITIREATANAALNGNYRVHEIFENAFSIDYRVPMNMQISDMQNMNGKFESFNSTKIYINVENLALKDELVFDYASGHGQRFPITEISQDEFGVYASVRGNLNNKPKTAVKSHFNLQDENFIRFTYETKVSYYNVSETNPQTHSLWMSHLPDITQDGRMNDDLSFIQIYNEDLEKIVSSTTQSNTQLLPVQDTPSQEQQPAEQSYQQSTIVQIEDDSSNSYY